MAWCIGVIPTERGDEWTLRLVWLDYSVLHLAFGHPRYPDTTLPLLRRLQSNRSCYLNMQSIRFLVSLDMALYVSDDLKEA